MKKSKISTVAKSLYLAERVRDTLDFADGTTFIFDFVNRGSYWDIDIISQPSYNGRNGDSHRINSSTPGITYKVCLSNKYEANSKYKAKEFAQDWAERTWKFIKQGKTF